MATTNERSREDAAIAYASGVLGAEIAKRWRCHAATDPDEALLGFGTARRPTGRIAPTTRAGRHFYYPGGGPYDLPLTSVPPLAAVNEELTPFGLAILYRAALDFLVAEGAGATDLAWRHAPSIVTETSFASGRTTSVLVMRGVFFGEATAESMLGTDQANAPGLADLLKTSQPMANIDGVIAAFGGDPATFFDRARAGTISPSLDVTNAEQTVHAAPQIPSEQAGNVVAFRTKDRLVGAGVTIPPRQVLTDLVEAIDAGADVSHLVVACAKDGAFYISGSEGPTESLWMLEKGKRELLAMGD